MSREGPGHAPRYPTLTEAQKARALDELAQEYRLDNLRPMRGGDPSA
jgi:hypothetical protein